MSGSQSYDPFAYGSVRIGGDDGPAKKSAESPDDILFAGEAAPPGSGRPGGARMAMAAETDTSWDPMDPDTGVPGTVSGLQATDVGADILGETAPPPRLSRPSATLTSPPPAPAAAPAARNRPAKAAVDSSWEQAVASGSPRPAPGTVVTPAQGLRNQPLRRRASALSVIVPSLLASGALAGAAWLFLVVRNPVMAAITAAVGLVAAAFSWISLRP